MEQDRAKLKACYLLMNIYIFQSEARDTCMPRARVPSFKHSAELTSMTAAEASGKTRNAARLAAPLLSVCRVGLSAAPLEIP